jgi:hypothetical protein
MITTVSTWRCKCGAHIKVVGQAEKNQPSTQKAQCPKCGDSQLIYCEKILSITVEEETRVR